MENVYTCTCGNQTWIILEGKVRCATCKLEFDVTHMPVGDFNRLVMEELEEEEV